MADLDLDLDLDSFLAELDSPTEDALDDDDGSGLDVDDVASALDGEGPETQAEVDDIVAAVLQPELPLSGASYKPEVQNLPSYIQGPLENIGPIPPSAMIGGGTLEALVFWLPKINSNLQRLCALLASESGDIRPATSDEKPATTGRGRGRPRKTA